jgi:hypothetical protein
MKMRILVGALLGLFMFSAVAEESTSVREGLKMAVGGGIFFNTLETDEKLGDDIEKETSASLNVGARALYHFNDQWALRSGIYLQEKSARLSFDNGIVDGVFTVKFISASIPVNVQYSFSDKFSIFGGYVGDFKINEYCDTSCDLKECSLTEDAKSVVHHANLGVSIWANDHLEVDLSYQRALSDTMESLKIHSFLAQLFYKFQ